MPRAAQPVTFDEVKEATRDYYPQPTYETKVEDFGRIGAKVLALDYGLPWSDLVADTRTYYATHRSVAA